MQDKWDEFFILRSLFKAGLPVYVHVCFCTRRLFSPALSRMSPRYPLDFEHLEKNHPALLSNTLLDAKFAMEQAVRTDRLRVRLTNIAI